MSIWQLMQRPTAVVMLLLLSWTNWITPLLLLVLPPGLGCNKLSHDFYFFNEVTGETQWTDPGDVPFEDELGVRWWYLEGNPEGERIDPDSAKKTREDPFQLKYVWVEQFDEEKQQAFFYNQETKEMTEERPADLAWRRIPVSEDSDAADNKDPLQCKL